MKILHYFLGFPPYRSGGLTRFAFDLMETQHANGDDVVAVWPGEIKIISKQTRFKKGKTIKGIENYELINPLPVSLDEGIIDTAIFIKNYDKGVFEDFINKIRPEVFHIHTLMGLPKEFVEVANSKGVKTIFTTHDYFGICPKVTLFTGGDVCDNDFNCMMCEQCNSGGLSYKKIVLLQSPLYRVLKNSSIVSYLRKLHRSAYYENSIEKKSISFDKLKISENYTNLRKYYVEILEAISIIHYNSELTKSIYEKYISPKMSKVVSISHKNIRDNRSVFGVEQGEVLRLAMLAPPSTIKGFDYLTKTLDSLSESTKLDFTLKVYGHVPEYKRRDYLIVEENGFKNDDLENVLSNVDIVIVPSIWYETFGFTVLESLSYGVPVIVTNRVGAACIVGDAGVIVDVNDDYSLEKVLKGLSIEKVMELKKHAKLNKLVKCWTEFVKEMYELYEY